MTAARTPRGQSAPPARCEARLWELYKLAFSAALVTNPHQNNASHALLMAKQALRTFEEDERERRIAQFNCEVQNQ
jgi:hypothetical protein